MLRVGFIGLGMGRAHMKGAAAHADAKVVACCDIVEERRKNKDGVDKYGREAMEKNITDAVSLLQ